MLLLDDECGQQRESEREERRRIKRPQKINFLGTGSLSRSFCVDED